MRAWVGWLGNDIIITAATAAVATGGWPCCREGRKLYTDHAVATVVDAAFDLELGI